MNINSPFWGDSFGSRSELELAPNNIRAGARMLKGIIGNFQSPASISEIATLYNRHDAKKLTDYGARVASVYRYRPWEKELVPKDAPVSY